MTRNFYHDVLVIGSGAAGMTLALRLAGQYSVALLTKGDLTSGSTWNAQGGIATVSEADDSFAAHIRDTLSAGAGLCHRDVVAFTVGRGPEAIAWLIDQRSVQD